MMSYNEYKAMCTAKVAGPQKETSTTSTSLPSTSSSISNLTETAEDRNEVFTFIEETYRDIRRYNSGLRKDNISTQLLQTINKYKSGCNAVFNKSLESNDACHKLSQNIVRTIDIFKELCECLTDLEEYYYRLCEIISIFVACELRLSVDAAPQEKQLIAHRIVYIMRRHLVQEEEQETLYNILRTLVFIPRLFDARDIMCAIFGIFIPIKPMPEVKILPDKLYMLYIIIFYRWMMMQNNDDNKMSIVNFAESFMKPSVSLCSNKLYAAFLPMYNTHSTATRTILNNLKCYRDLRNATILNNALNKIGALVNLCDDEDDDIIVIETSPATDFHQIFASVHLEPLSGCMSNIKLEEKTVVGTVDLTAEEEISYSPTSISARHEKWLNEFHRLAKQHRESQLLLERQQNIQQISENRIEAVICLDSDSEDDEEITVGANASTKTTQATISKELYQTPAKTQQNNAEDLFVDSYPITTTPINCEFDFESLDAEDENDVTKISPRFLTGTLRTYQGKKSNLLEKEDERNSDDDDDDAHNRTQDSVKAYRRDSIHISFSPQERTQNDDDEGTDVQDEHDDLLEEEEETSAYTFLPTTSKKPEKEIFAKQIRPMGPYPTYNNMHNDKVLFSQSLSRYPQQTQQQYQDKQYYYSDSSETKTPKQQKKRVQFNPSPLGPTVSIASQKIPLKSALQRSKYKASEAPDVFHLRGFERLSFASSIAGSTSTTASNSTSSSTKQQDPTNEIYNNLSTNNVKNHNHNNISSDMKPKSTKNVKKDPKKQRPDNNISSCAPSITGSNATSISTSSSIKQQEHLEAAVTLFRNIVDRPRQSFFYPAPFSPSSSSVSSRSLTSPATPSTTRKKSRLPKNKIPTLNLRRCTMGTRDDFMKNSELAHNNNGERYSIIRNREILNDGYQSAGFPSTASYNDDYYGVASDSDIVINSRYKNDAKLRKRCAVVIKPTKELRQYERKRDKMYNEILQEQRRKLELRALEKQREKERRLMDKTEEQSFQTRQNDRGATKATMDRVTKTSKKSKNVNEIFLSSESEYETNFEVRTRKQRQQYVKDLQPLNIQIEMTEATTTSLLSQIDAHLKKPESEKSTQYEEKEPQQEKWERAEKEDHINQQTCDIISDKGQKKTGELNLLADIAQHLSPYHLDLPQNNNPTRTPSPAPALEANEKAIVTEHLIIQQEVAVNSYAHEPKLNVAANLKSSSPCANAMSPKISSVETLEQILEKSISVLKSVTSPLNNLKESSSTAAETQIESTFPLLISNVESLNNIERHVDIAQQKSEDKVPLLSATDILIKDKNESKTKDVRCEEQTEHMDSNKPVVILSSTILNPIENSLICAADVANISNESAITQAPKESSLMTAELSDISLESEISKHLPEIAEPSPVVTDMSDNSNDSGVSQNFGLHNSIISNSTGSNEISLPDLNLVLPSIQQPQTLPATTHQESIETSLIHFNTSLYTPTKLAVLTSEEQTADNCSNDLNTPLKFSMQPELESEALKITLEPEADNNVTKFLDLILNKTVTDAESETRDKIIKELNALTTEATNLEPEACETEVFPTDSVENQKGVDKSSKTTKEIVENKSVESDKMQEAEHESLKDDRLREKSNILKEPEFSQKTLEYFPEGHKENNDSALENVETENTVRHFDVLQTPSSNNALNPPKENPKQEKHINLEISESAVPILSPVNKNTKSALKQTFNIKCRVRLKRLNIDEHSKTIKNETWIAIPISKPEEPVNLSNELIKCDTVIETKSIIKKPCLKTSNKRSNEVLSPNEQSQDNEETPTKKAKIENETATATATSIEREEIFTSQPTNTFTPPSSTASIFINTTAPISSKSKNKTLKTVTFDLSNLSDELRDTSTTMTSNPKHKSKSYAASMALGCYLKNSRPPRKLPDNTLRAAETLQLFVNTINDSTRTQPPAEFNKKRSPIKNKCIAEDETPRPPPTSTLMGTPTCKKSCTEKSRTQINVSKSKDQLVSSLATPSISSITNDITTARIYTSSPLDQTLPEYDDNVDTVADSELILPTTTGSLRRKLKRPKKSLTRPEPPDDIGTDDISNQPECNGEDDTDAVVDNEDDVFSEELLPIPTANEHILEDIVSARPSHIGPGTVIRDEYMNIEATATVPVYLFNDESRDLATPEPIQSSDTTNVVDSSSYLNTSCTIANNVEAATAASTTSALGSLEKSMLSPSEHEVSSTQETFYQTPTKNKQTETFGEKTSTNKDKVNGTSSSTTSSNNGQKQKPEDKSFKNKDYQTSSTTGLLQNNQVDTTNHSPEMCNLALTATPMSTSTTASSNRKLRKATTHDEILYNEMQQLPSNKRKSTNTTTICAESTSDNSSKPKIVTKNLEDVKTNGSLAKIDDKFKKLLKGVCQNDKIQNSNELEVGAFIAGNNSGGGGGGSSPSTTTIINEETLSRSKRKKLKSSKASKTKNYIERSTKIVLKASKLTPHTPANPLIITIPKSRILRPPSTPTPPSTFDESQDEQSEFLDIPNAKLFIEKEKEPHKLNQPTKRETTKDAVSVSSKTKRSLSPLNMKTEINNLKTSTNSGNESHDVKRNTNSTTSNKEKSSSTFTITTTKKKDKPKTTNSSSSSSSSSTNTTCTNSNNDDSLVFVKDKYDLIKSKDKHHLHNHNQHNDRQEFKEKPKDKTKSHTKSSTSSSNVRVHKRSTKEKIKGEKFKEKHKTKDKSAAHSQMANVLKLNTSESSNKNSLTSFATASAPSSYASDSKTSIIKSSKNNSSSSSLSSFSILLTSSLSATDIHKSKMNLLTTQSSSSATATAASANASAQINTATLSTNNVRKKMKIK